MSNLNYDLPYNPGNTLLDANALDQLIHQYNPKIKFNDINLYRNAFVHKSYCTRKNENFNNGNLQCPPNCLPLQEESNERLEFLGDAVLNLVIGNYLFTRYPDESEGFLTKIRTKLVNGNMLSDLARMANLQHHVLISKQIEDNFGRQNKKILEDCFEAFLGAMFIDMSNSNVSNPLQCVSDWIINLIENNIDFTELLMKNTNYKDTFLKYFQHNFNYLPKFFELSSENTSTGKSYRVVIKDHSNAIISAGSGPTKKAAENDAAHMALKYYGQC